MSKNPTHTEIEDDVKKNKIKQGMVIKQSRHLKQWKERWMVLTRTHIYSFNQKGVYKNPTEIIALNKTLTVKSYYKMQQDKPHIFRIQTPDIYLYLSPKSSEEKWAWMTAIEKMLNRAFTPDEKPDTSQRIRETLKVATAMRETMNNLGNTGNFSRISFLKQQTKKQDYSKKEDMNQILEKLKLQIANQTYSIEIESPKKTGSPSQKGQNSSLSEKLNPVKQTESPPKAGKIEGQVQKLVKIIQKRVQVPVEKEKIVEKIVEKIIYVPEVKERIVDKTIYVPEIREKVVEKIVYVDNNSEGSKGYLETMFKDIMSAKIDNPKPMIDFIIFILTSHLEKYYPTIISFLMSTQTQRFFAEIFLIMLNEETDEYKLNIYLQFLTILYENADEYFYSSDVKVLIDIILREMELNRSQFNQYLLMNFIKTISTKSWWKKLNHRIGDMRMMVKELESISGPENQMLAQELLDAN